MKYILFLAFEYKHYKKPATIELFADDLLIDSIELHESIGRKNGEWKHPYDNPEFHPPAKKREHSVLFFAWCWRLFNALK